MKLSFQKMHGAGNDFVVVIAGAGLAVPDMNTIAHLGDRRRGIGFDQLLWVEPSDNPDLVAHYRIFNTDGTEVEQCGNGARCVAKVLAELTGLSGEFSMSSTGGPIGAKVLADGQVSVNMGVPDLDPASLPFSGPSGGKPQTPIETSAGTRNFSLVSMGNPHAVLLVDSVDTAPVSTLGPELQQHAQFPQRVNVGFLEVVNRSNVRLRVFERGVGETLACGTGACAAMVAGHRLDLLDDEVQLEVPGGTLMVNWVGGDKPVWLTGPAEVSFEGTVNL
ncbi:MAG: diaminopimelate epimerase [Pseudomonadota bacterium]